jgi:hypothetical protein
MRKGSRELYRRQLAAADSSSLYTIVTNRLGVPAEVELDFGDHWCAYGPQKPLSSPSYSNSFTE